MSAGKPPQVRPALIVLRAEHATLVATLNEIRRDATISEDESLALIVRTSLEIADLEEAIEQLQFFEDWRDA